MWDFENFHYWKINPLGNGSPVEIHIRFHVKLRVYIGISHSTVWNMVSLGVLEEGSSFYNLFNVGESTQIAVDPVWAQVHENKIQWKRGPNHEGALEWNTHSVPGFQTAFLTPGCLQTAC